MISTRHFKMMLYHERVSRWNLDHFVLNILWFNFAYIQSCYILCNDKMTTKHRME